MTKFGSLWGGETYIKTDHEVDVIDFHIFFEELGVENVSYESIYKDDACVQRQQAAMSTHVSALFTDETFSALSQKPMQHPVKQDDHERRHFVDIECVPQHHGEDEELEYFLLALVYQVLRFNCA